MNHAILPVAVHVILVRNDKILLLHRENTGFNDDKWSVPAGRLDSGESIISGAIREAEEEVGVKIDPKNFESTLIMHHHDDRGERIYSFFLCREWENEPVNSEPDKCKEIAWFKIVDLPETTIKHVKVAIESILKGVNYLEFGF